MNRVIAAENALGHVRRMEYDANGNVVATTTPVGERSTSKYSDSNELIEQSDPLGNTVLSEYDEHGRQASVTDPRGKVTVNTYNDFDELITSTTDATLPDEWTRIVRTINV